MDDLIKKQMLCLLILREENRILKNTIRMLNKKNKTSNTKNFIYLLNIIVFQPAFYALTKIIDLLYYRKFSL